MPQRTYRFQLKSTGKTYEMPWDAEAEPTSLDKKQYAWEQDNKSGLKKAWDWANEPLTDLPSRVGRAFADDVDKPTMDEPTRIPFTGGMTWKGLIGGLAEGAGDVASSFTSPLSAGLTLLGAGEVAAAKRGLTGTSAAFNAAQKLTSAGLGAHGAYKVATGVGSGNLGDVGAGAVELAGAGLGMKSGYGRVVEDAAANRPRFTRSVSNVGAEKAAADAARPTRLRLGAGRVLTPDPGVLDADFRIVGDSALPGSQTPRELPGSRGFYAGRSGVSSDLGSVTEEGLPARSPAEAAFNASIPERFKPTPSGKGTTGHYGYQPETARAQEGFYGRGTTEPMPFDNLHEDFRQPMRDMMDEVAGPFSKASDSDVRFLAESGDAAAKKEALRRPSLRDMFREETGAIGPGADDLIKRRRAQVEEPILDEAGRELGGTTTPKTVLPAGTQARLRAMGINENEINRMGIDEANTLLGSGKVAEPVRTEKSNMRDVLDSFGKNIKRVVKEEKGFWKPFGKKADDTPDSPSNVFADWVNARRATKIEGILKKKEFADLDALGQDGIFDFQEGVRDGRLKDVADYFDSKFNELSKGGVKLGYRENYLPQLWEEDPETVKNVYRRLGLKPSFTLERVLENYRAGIDEGLTPKFTTISDLVGWYEGKANKAIADRRFFDYLRKNDLIAPKGQAPAGWETLDPDHFPTQKFKSKNKVIEITMQAPPEIARMVNNYLRVPESTLDFRKPGAALQWIADKASLSKNMAMSAGFPGTAINAHGFNILARTVVGNPKEAFKAGRYLINPKAAKNYLDEALHTAPQAIRAGLTLTTEGHEMGVTGSTNLAGKAFQKFLSVQGKLFEDPLFQNVIPALKLKHFNDMAADLGKTMPKGQAMRQAAEFTNNLYGGINWEAMGRSRDLGNIARTFILAPDWLASNVNLGNGMARTLLDPKNPQGRAYAKMARNIIGAYVAADVMNYALTEHHMWENSPGHALDIQAGTSDGKIRWIRPFGTAADFLRLPYDAASAALGSGDLGTSSEIAKNRMSIPARAGFDLLSKRDRFNRPFLGKDDYGRPIPLEQQVGGVAGELSAMVTPPYVKSIIDASTGRVGPEEAIMGAGEMPVRYSHIPRRRSASRRSRR